MMNDTVVSHRKLASQALQSAGLDEPVGRLRVMSEYTHLVLGCSLERPIAGGAGSTPAVVIKFWRNESKQPLDAYAHRLAAAAVPVPSILGLGYINSPVTGRLTPRFTVSRGEPLAFTVYQFIGGRPAAELEQRWSPHTIRQAYKTAGLWLARIHALRVFERGGPLARFPDGWQGTAGDWYDYFSEQLERWDQELAEHSVARSDRRLRRLVRDWMLEQVPSLASVDRFVLCHRDFSFRNLLANYDGRLCAVIDFEHAVAGDPVFDWHRVAARLLCHNRDHAAWLAFLEGYVAGAGAAAADLVVAQRLPAAAGDPITGLTVGLTATAASRLMVYLAFYGISGMGYALREGDMAFYQQSVALMQWVAQAVN